jgi:hypothetical protein
MFSSFFLAGFEGSTGYNRSGDWFDQVVATGHDRSLNEDYSDIAALGMRAARETVRWPLVDLGRGRYDFSSIDPFLKAARRHGVEVIWDLFHYGYPRDVDLLGRDFPQRFAEYCYAVARYIDARTEGTCYFTPVNEPSFLAFAGGHAGLFAPHLRDRGEDLKIALCRAAITAIGAIWAASDGARIVNVDPLCRVVSRGEGPKDQQEVDHFNDSVVFESWDMIGGRLLPELGGSPAHLDIIGINYYWTNQWEWGHPPLPDGRIPPLAEDDPRRAPLSELIGNLWRRYGHDFMISETAHVGDGRAPWLLEVARQSELILEENMPLLGVCLYPILGMPEWHEPDVWTPMGLWDPVCHREPAGARLVCSPMLEALSELHHLGEVRDRMLARRSKAAALKRRKKGEAGGSIAAE